MKLRIFVLLFLSIFSLSTGFPQSDWGKHVLSHAEAGETNNMAILGMYYLIGSEGFTQDKGKGVEWCLKAGKNGYPSGYYFLGHYLIECFKDYDEGVKYLQIACDKCKGEDRARAAEELGGIYHYGKWNHNVDINNAIKYYRIASSIDEDYVSPYTACWRLGDIYKDKGVKEEAIFWYKKAMDINYAKEGDIDMDTSDKLVELGVYYHPEDKTTTRISNESSSEQSHSHALSSNAESNTHKSSSSSYTPEYGYRDVWVDCSHCHGDGKCPSCGGVGWCVSTYSNGNYNSTYTCPVCHGNRFCTICGGTKGHYEKQMYQIK